MNYSETFTDKGELDQTLSIIDSWIISARFTCNKFKWSWSWQVFCFISLLRTTWTTKASARTFPQWSVTWRSTTSSTVRWRLWLLTSPPVETRYRKKFTFRLPAVLKWKSELFYLSHICVCFEQSTASMWAGIILKMHNSWSIKLIVLLFIFYIIQDKLKQSETMSNWPWQADLHRTPGLWVPEVRLEVDHNGNYKYTQPGAG